jgi:hypothetical protein
MHSTLQQVAEPLTTVVVWPLNACLATTSHSCREYERPLVESDPCFDNLPRLVTPDKHRKEPISAETAEFDKRTERNVRIQRNGAWFKRIIIITHDLLVIERREWFDALRVRSDVRWVNDNQHAGVNGCGANLLPLGFRHAASIPWYTRATYHNLRPLTQAALMV